MPKIDPRMTFRARFGPDLAPERAADCSREPDPVVAWVPGPRSESSVVGLWRLGPGCRPLACQVAILGSGADPEMLGMREVSVQVLGQSLWELVPKSVHEVYIVSNRCTRSLHLMAKRRVKCTRSLHLQKLLGGLSSVHVERGTEHPFLQAGVWARGTAKTTVDRISENVEAAGPAARPRSQVLSSLAVRNRY